MQEKKMQAGYNATIPAFVRYDKELTMGARMLYGEITALCNKEGYCWATNSYFADLYEVSIDTVSRWVTSLEKKGYIKRVVVYKENSKEVKERRIYLPEARFSVQKEKEKEKPKQEKVKKIEEVEVDPVLKEFAKLYEQNIGIINGVTAEYIKSLIEDDFDIRLFKRAIEIATDKGNCNLGYIKGIIRKWLSKKILTFEDLEAYRLQENQKEIKENDSDNRDCGTNKATTDGTDNGANDDEEYRKLLEEAKRRTAEYLEKRRQRMQ